MLEVFLCVDLVQIFSCVGNGEYIYDYLILYVQVDIVDVQDKRFFVNLVHVGELRRLVDIVNEIYGHVEIGMVLW